MKRSTHKQLGLVGLIVIGLVGGCQTSRQPSDQPPTAHLPAVTVTATSKPWPRSFTDDLGNAVTLNKPPQRIISLSPNLTEMLLLVGAGQQLAGRTDFCDYPAEAQAKPSIGGIINPSLERLVSLEPDLVLAARGVAAAFLDRLEEMQIPFLGYDPQTLDDVIALVRRIGRITGHDQQADEAAAALAERKASVAAQHRGADNKLRVLFVLSRDPLFVSGATSFVDDMMGTCGARNAIRDVSTIDKTRPWPQASREAVVAADPQLVIIAQRHGVQQPETSQAILTQLQRLPAWREVAAVKAGQVHLINDDLVTIPGPRLIEGLEEISRLVDEAAGQYTIQPGQ
ncbi:MAG: ABC transporter substrate-binding protein [Armatimonadetes bacterium]|nr:ABC transporter substrate-binding protein [Armatimonadota bacterium]